MRVDKICRGPILNLREAQPKADDPPQIIQRGSKPERPRDQGAAWSGSLCLVTVKICAFTQGGARVARVWLMVRVVTIIAKEGIFRSRVVDP